MRLKTVTFLSSMYMYMCPCSLTLTYPIFICNVDISPLANKVVHCVHMASFSCNVQGSALMGERNKYSLCYCCLKYSLCVVVPDEICYCKYSLCHCLPDEITQILCIRMKKLQESNSYTLYSSLR